MCRIEQGKSGLIKLSRDAGTGVAVGATCPHNFEAVGAPPPPPTLDCESRSFYFCLFLHVNTEHGSLPKNSGPNPGSFQFWVVVTLDPGRPLPPPPPPTLQSSSRAPGGIWHPTGADEGVRGTDHIPIGSSCSWTQGVLTFELTSD